MEGEGSEGSAGHWNTGYTMGADCWLGLWCFGGNGYGKAVSWRFYMGDGPTEAKLLQQ